MKPRIDVPIEPLSDAAWHRIEQTLFDQLPGELAPVPASVARRTRVPRWLAVAIAADVALQVAAGVAFFLERSHRAEPVALESTRFVTAREATETMFDDAALRIEPESELIVVRQGASSSLVVLERGAAQFSVAPREQRPAFVIQAGDVRVRVVGTRFRVERVGGSARVQAFEGTVRVVSHGERVLLHGGQRWPASDSAQPALAPSTDRSSPGATAIAEAGAARAPADSDERKEPAASARADRSRRRFERGASLEATDPEQALRIYRLLAAGASPWAANALYAMGRLEFERGRFASASELLHRYLDRYPQGANAADVRSLVARITAGSEGAEQ